MSLAIIDTVLLTMEGKTLGIIENGAIGIRKNEIDFVGNTKNLDKNSYEKIIDGSTNLVLPGLINGHFHSTSSLLRGCAQDVPELEWMKKALGPIAKHLTPEDKILGSKLAIIEGLITGTTTFAEYTSNVESVIQDVYRPWGIRVVAAETINEISQDTTKLKPTELYEFDRDKGEKALHSNLELIKKSQNDELITPMLGPQALDMVSLDLLKSIFEFSDEFDVKIHMHVAQGGRERIQIANRYGSNKSTVNVLEENNFLNNHLYAAHCHDTTIKEQKKMVEHDVSYVSCQSSIAMIDGIIPPLYNYIKFGGKASIGTDQIPGVGHSNLFREMRTASILAKTSFRNPTLLPPWIMLKLATIEGAKALGIDNTVGSLKVGKKADIITIDRKSLSFSPVISRPFRNYIPNLIYSTSGYDVNNVIINGKTVVENGRFQLENKDTIISKAEKRAHFLMKKAEKDWRNANSLLVKFVNNGFL